jgi:hypothetical protein
MFQRTPLTDEERTILSRVKQRNTRLRRAARTEAEIFVARLARHPDGTKPCRGCTRDLAFDRFPTAVREADGLGTRCLECHLPRTTTA